MEEKIVDRNINDINKEWFLEYAQEVLQNRALPDAEDGLIVAQRQLLWVMNKIIKMKPEDKFKKSASLVGSTMATAYVHGDAALYDVLRNLALPFVMRYPLIEPHGSMGTQEASDLFAAARYTEARPSSFINLMMNDFDKNVVIKKPTYTNEDYEPVVLPSLLPNALVNGHQGIGVSMSSNTLPHNLTEVCNVILLYLQQNGQITTDDILRLMPGPDFPTGGTIINPNVIRTAYETGHGNTSIKIRGDYYIDGNKIIFTSIPYRTFRDNIRKQLAKNIEEVEKYFDDFNDDSQIGEIKLVFNLKDKSLADEALSYLFDKTDLQSSINYNNNFVYHGTPRLCSMKDLIAFYVEHQRDIKIKAAAFDRAKAEKKVNILGGLLKVIPEIDRVIALIKASANKTEARESLEKNFSLNEEQANAILDLKLSRLTKLELTSIEAELKSNNEIISECERISSDPVYRDNCIKNDVEEMKRKFGDARRTKIAEITETKIGTAKKAKVNRNMTLGIFNGNLIAEITDKRLKPQQVFECSSNDHLAIFTDNNICYKLKVDKIKTTSGDLYELCGIDRAEKILACALPYEGEVTYVTSKGFIKKSNLSEYSSSVKGAIGKLEENDKIISLFIDADNITLTSSNLKKLSYSLDAISTTGRATRGVLAMSLEDSEKIISAEPVLTEKYLGKRNTKGKK